MPSAPKICFDRVLPRDLRRQQMTRTVNGRVRAVSPKGKQWVNGITIRIHLRGGTPSDRTLVESVAPRWTDHANLTFEFTDDPRADIRVTFDENDGAWSYIGLDNANIPLHAATLNLGWVDEGVILHEFGHMIGLGHEHQNPGGGIEWNEAAVISDLSGPPNNWDTATIEHNVLRKYETDQIHGTEFDPESIMLYAFPDSWTTNMGATQSNDHLSDIDKQFIASADMYPHAVQPEDRAVELEVRTHVAAAIEDPGNEDLFRFEVKQPGWHQIETTGSTDIVMTLLGPGSLSQFIAEDDDGGSHYNARIRSQLSLGTYYVRVKHYDDRGTGEYRIAVTAG